MIKQLIKSTTPNLTGNSILEEALKITGLSISALYKKTMDKAIPFKSFGNRIIFSRRELKEWEETNTTSKPQKKLEVTKMECYKKCIMVLLVLFLALFLCKGLMPGKGNTNPYAVSTFECSSDYWKTPEA